MGNVIVILMFHLSKVVRLNRLVFMQLLLMLIGILPRVMEREYLEHDFAASVKQGMVLWVVSHGGVGTKSLAEHLDKEGIKIRTPQWHETLVHAHRPVTTTTNKFKGALYVYGDPVLSICSMKRQGNARLNLMKLSDHSETGNEELKYKYSDGALMQAIYNQFQHWTNSHHQYGYPIITLTSYDVFDEKCQAEIGRKLGLQFGSYKADIVRLKRREERREECLKTLNLTSAHMSMVTRILSYTSSCGNSISTLRLKTGRNPISGDTISKINELWSKHRIQHQEFNRKKDAITMTFN